MKWRYEPSTKTIRSIPENYWIAAPEMYALLDRASHLLSLPFNHELHNGSTFEALRNKINALLAEIDRGES